MAKTDSLRFLRTVPDIRTKKPAQKLVLFALAQRANNAGTCYPSYERLMQDTGLSRGSVFSVLRYLRDELKVLDWKQGHSNQYMTPMANLYTLDYDRMLTLSQEGAEFTGCTQHDEVLSSNHEVLSSNHEVLSSKRGVAEFTGCTPTTQASTAQFIQLPNPTTTPALAGTGIHNTPQPGAVTTTGPSVLLSSRDELSKKFEAFCEGMQ